MAIRGTTVVDPRIDCVGGGGEGRHRRRREAGVPRRQLDGGAAARAAARADDRRRRPAGQPRRGESPAETGGLLVGDVIVGFDGEAVAGAGGARHAAARQPGRRGRSDHRDSRHERRRCNRHRQRASKTQGIVPLRVFLSGRASDELDALRDG